MNITSPDLYRRQGGPQVSSLGLFLYGSTQEPSKKLQGYKVAICDHSPIIGVVFYTERFVHRAIMCDYEPQNENKPASYVVPTVTDLHTRSGSNR